MQTTQNQKPAVNTELFSWRDTFFTPLPKLQIISSDCSRTLSGTNVTCDKVALMTCMKIQQSSRQRCDSKLPVLIGTQLRG